VRRASRVLVPYRYCEKGKTACVSQGEDCMHESGGRLRARSMQPGVRLNALILCMSQPPAAYLVVHGGAKSKGLEGRSKSASPEVTNIGKFDSATIAYRSHMRDRTCNPIATMPGSPPERAFLLA
jgi:hypothetical protein